MPARSPVLQFPRHRRVVSKGLFRECIFVFKVHSDGHKYDIFTVHSTLYFLQKTQKCLLEELSLKTVEMSKVI